MSASPPPTHATKRSRDITPPTTQGEPGSVAALDVEPESDEDDIGSYPFRVHLSVFSRRHRLLSTRVALFSLIGPMPDAGGDNDDLEDGPQPPTEQKKRKKRKGWLLSLSWMGKKLGTAR